MTDDANALMEDHTYSTSDLLEQLNTKVREAGDIMMHIADLEEQLERQKRHLHALEREMLPEMFGRLGISSVEVQPRGNQPSYVAKLSPYYRAMIAAGWSAERRALAFEALERLHLDGLIKAEVKAVFNKEEVKKARELVSELSKKHINADLSQAVHHKTLTAAVKELCESGRCPSDGDLELIGAQVGKVVTIKRS